MPIENVTIHESGVEVVVVGIQGPSGPPGNGFELSFLSPLLSWTVNHNLNRRPLVGLVTTGNVEIIGDIVHVSLNQLVVNFAVPTAGTIRCF